MQRLGVREELRGPVHSAPKAACGAVSQGTRLVGVRGVEGLRAEFLREGPGAFGFVEEELQAEGTLLDP